MSSQEFLALFLVCSLIILHNGVEARRLNITVEEDLELEKQLKMLNKPAIKTIMTDYGDIYDCVDFYKQPAFDHPLLKNYKVDFPLEAATRPRKHIDRVSRNETALIKLGLKDGGCPVGTVPIQRITKEDLIREKLAVDVRPLLNDDVPGAHYAVCRTKLGPTRYSGAFGAGSVWQPEVTGQQYSAGRMKISNAADSLEVGWRVDPTLFGDTNTRFYIRTDVGQSHCFNTRCPGFIIVDTCIPLGIRLESSQRGGSIEQFTLFLNQNTIIGNWYLQILEEKRVIGFWPKQLFTSLGDAAASVEWGGEVFSPPGSPKPQMGSGYLVPEEDTAYDAYFGSLSLATGTTIADANNLETFVDNDYYFAIDEGNTRSADFRHLMFYGGSVAPNI